MKSADASLHEEAVVVAAELEAIDVLEDPLVGEGAGS